MGSASGGTPNRKLSFDKALVGMRTDTRGFREADPSESLVDLAHDFLDRGLHQVDVRLVGILQLVEKTSPPGLVALVGTAEVEADAARIPEESGQDVRVPFAVIGNKARRIGREESGSVRHEHGPAGDLVPGVHLGHRLPEILERQHVHVAYRGLDEACRQGSVRLIAIAQEKMMRVVPANGIVDRLVVVGGQVHEFRPADRFLQPVGIEDRAAPRVLRPGVNPGRAVAIEIPDQVRVFAQFGAVRTRHVVHPLLPFRAPKVEVASVLLPLVRLGEREQVAVRHFKRPVFFMGERPGVPPPANRDFLHPADRVEAPALEIGRDRLPDPSQGASAVLVSPEMHVLRIPQAGRVDVIQADREEGLALGRNQPPAALALREREEAVRGELRRRAHGRTAAQARSEPKPE